MKACETMLICMPDPMTFEGGNLKASKLCVGLKASLCDGFGL